MNSIAAFSFIIHDHHGADRLARFFHSLAAQDLPANRLEVCIVSTGESDDVIRLARRCNEYLCGFALQVIPASGERASAAMNLGLDHCSGLLAACIHPGLRLDPLFVTQHLAALRDRPEADIFCADFVQSGRRGTGLIRSHGPLVDRLRSLDTLGPLPVFTARARRICRFRDASPFPSWELGIQAAQRGLRFCRVHSPLYSVNHSDWKSSGTAEELARLVTRQCGFFHVDQVRWALSVLRHQAWALAHNALRIPSPREVRELMETQVWEQRLPQFGHIPVEVLPSSIPTLGALGA